MTTGRGTTVNGGSGAGGSGLGRRAVLLGGLAGVLAGCATTPRADPSATPSATSTSPPFPTEPAPPATPPPPTQVTPEPVAAYAVLDGEEEPAAKATAAALLQALAAWAPGQAGPDAAKARLVELGEAPELVDQVPQLVGAEGAAATQVVYPQYGGLSARRDTASLMTVVEQRVWLPGETDPTVRSDVIDVRLRREGDRWVCNALLPAAPGAAGDPAELDPSVQVALDDERIVLPGPAQADLLSGGVIPAVSQMLVELSKTWRLHVCVVQSGHPQNVYDTDRPSNHTRGRAVDIWAIDGVPVILHGESAWEALMRRAVEIGADEVGGPKDLDGVRGRRPFFSDAVHQDHVHLGFEPRDESTGAPVQ